MLFEGGCGFSYLETDNQNQHPDVKLAKNDRS